MVKHFKIISPKRLPSTQSKLSKNRRLSATKTRMGGMYQQKALESLSDADILHMNADDPPSRLFGVCGLYQQVKAQQRSYEEKMSYIAPEPRILGSTWSDANVTFIPTPNIGMGGSHSLEVLPLRQDPSLTMLATMP